MKFRVCFSTCKLYNVTGATGVVASVVFAGIVATDYKYQNYGFDLYFFKKSFLFVRKIMFKPEKSSWQRIVTSWNQRTVTSWNQRTVAGWDQITVAGVKKVV